MVTSESLVATHVEEMGNPLSDSTRFQSETPIPMQRLILRLSSLVAAELIAEFRGLILFDVERHTGHL